MFGFTVGQLDRLAILFGAALPVVLIVSVVIAP